MSQLQHPTTIHSFPIVFFNKTCESKLGDLDGQCKRKEDGQAIFSNRFFKYLFIFYGFLWLNCKKSCRHVFWRHLYWKLLSAMMIICKGNNAVDISGVVHW